MTVTRRAFVGAAIAIVWDRATIEARQNGSVHRIGLLLISPLSARDRTSLDLHAAFRQSLEEFGWIEGRNVVIEHRASEGKSERFPELVTELLRLKVDVIVAGTDAAAQAALAATRTIPIVTIAVGDPVRLGFAESLARPGGNVTGTTFVPTLDVFGKQLEILLQIAAAPRRVGVLWNPTNPIHRSIVDEIGRVARGRGVSLYPAEARTADDIDRAFGAIVSRSAHAVQIVGDGLFLFHRARVVNLAIQHRLPVMYSQKEDVEAGGLVSYGPSLTHLFKRAAVYVDRVLRGERPQSLPMEQPTAFELVINRKTAKALGLTIPPSLLLRADHVIE